MVSQSVTDRQSDRLTDRLQELLELLFATKNYPNYHKRQSVNKLANR